MGVGAAGRLSGTTARATGTAAFAEAWDWAAAEVVLPVAALAVWPFAALDGEDVAWPLPAACCLAAFAASVLPAAGASAPAVA